MDEREGYNHSLRNTVISCARWCAMEEYAQVQPKNESRKPENETSTLAPHNITIPAVHTYAHSSRDTPHP